MSERTKPRALNQTQLSILARLRTGPATIVDLTMMVFGRDDEDERGRIQTNIYRLRKRGYLIVISAPAGKLGHLRQYRLCDDGMCFYCGGTGRLKPEATP